MIIGDDWFIKTMIVNTLYRTEKQYPQMPTSSSEKDKNLFTSVINQLLMEKELQLSLPTNLVTFEPNLELKNIAMSSDKPLRFQHINEEKLNQVLDGKLRGMGQIFLREGQRFNIDPALLAAIAQHETGNGKSRAAIEKNNIAGMMGHNGLKSYSSVEESIIDMARNLSKNYLGLGLSSIAKIGAKYAPVGANNDPTGLNNHWVSGVSKYYEEIRV